LFLKAGSLCEKLREGVSMKTFLKILAVLLLLFNGVGALFGGWYLMHDPTGNSIRLSPEFIRRTPFPDYFIPGIILFTANGLFSIFTLVMLLFNSRNYPYFVIAQGIILGGWLSVQLIMIRIFYMPMHVTCYTVAVGLIIAGYMLLKSPDKKSFLKTV
jgi:hypothetical protein